MPMVRAMRLLNAVELGSITSVQLESLLQDSSRALEWRTLCGMRGQTRRMATTAAPLQLITGSNAASDILVSESNGMKAICSRTATANEMANNAAFMDKVTASATAMSAVAASATAMSAVAASATAMSAVIASSTALSAVVASSTAMSAVAASATAMSAVIASSTAMTAVAASSTAMTAVAASATAMSAVAASSTAMTAVAASATAMSAVNASDTAMNAIYASPLVTKVNYSTAQTWSNETVIRNGAGLFVRLTSKAGAAGFGEGVTGNEWIEYDGSDVMYAERTANPYNHTALTSSPRHPMRKFNSVLKYRGYMAVEIAYIPL